MTVKIVAFAVAPVTVVPVIAVSAGRLSLSRPAFRQCSRTPPLSPSISLYSIS